MTARASKLYEWDAKDPQNPLEGSHPTRWYTTTDMNVRAFAYDAIKRARANGYESDIRSARRLADRMTSLGWECVWCGGPFEAIDHVMPLSLGGMEMLDNLVPCCKSCNSEKGNLPPDRWVDGEVMRGGCGTASAYKRHLKAGEKPCDACRENRAEYHRNYIARKKAAR